MDPAWVLSLPEDIAVTTAGTGEVVLLGPRARVVLRQLSPGLVAALRRLAAPGEAAGRLADAVLTAAGPDALARWYYFLQYLVRRCWLHLSANAAGERLATLMPTAPGFLLAPAGPFADQPFFLSRFAYCRRQGSTLVMESPCANTRIMLHDPRAAAFVQALAQPSTAVDLARRVPGLPIEAVVPLLGLFITAGMVGAAGADGVMAEDADPALGSWEFHDLLFHTRSREGRHDAMIGATYPLAGRFEPPPALPSAAATEGIDLFRPDLEQLQRHDPPFAHVQEQRRSLRDYAAEPITDEQLGEFLYRVARVKECQEMDVMTPAGPVRMGFAPRPYPAGGALYELEVYAVVNECRGVPPGLYHYEALNHRLSRRTGRNAAVEGLLAHAALASGMTADGLQVLLILSARIPRVAWKYAGLAYALVLKHVGVVYQTMYLAATAMGLAPCALGGGDSDLFARAAGVDYYAETSVGEFLLGSRR